MLGKTVHIGVLAGARENRGVTGGDRSSSLAFQRASDHDRSAIGLTFSHELVDEIDDVLRQPNGDLLGHPK